MNFAKSGLTTYVKTLSHKRVYCQQKFLLPHKAI